MNRLFWATLLCVGSLSGCVLSPASEALNDACDYFQKAELTVSPSTFEKLIDQTKTSADKAVREDPDMNAAKELKHHLDGITSAYQGGPYDEDGLWPLRAGGIAQICDEAQGRGSGYE